MDENSIPLSHIQLWLSIFGYLLTIAITSASVAWVCVKLVVRPIKQEIDDIKGLRKERGLEIQRLENIIMPEDANNRPVTLEQCRICQNLCYTRVHEQLELPTIAISEISKLMNEMRKSIVDIQLTMARIGERLRIPTDIDD